MVLPVSPLNTVKNMVKALSCTLALLLLSVAVLASEKPVNPNVVVVTHVDSPLPGLSKPELRSLFLGKRQEVYGIAFKPVDLEQWQGAKQAFYDQVVDKNASQLNAYWARKLFTGRSKPPHQVNDVRALYYYLRRNKQAVGYMLLDDVDPKRVKIIYP